MLSPAVDPAAHAVQFMQVAQMGTTLTSREDLRRWLACEVQGLLPHDALLAATGHFGRGDVHVELLVVQPTHTWVPASALMPLAHALRNGWIAAQHLPCRLDLSELPLPPSLRGLRGAWVHGMRECVPPNERVIALLGQGASRGEHDGQALRLLQPFIDTALRRLPQAPPRRSLCLASLDGFAPARLPLSERERQIMSWVAMGKTNPEIGCILEISEFTVKNHLKSVYTKLDVTNRAQAVAKLTGLSVYA